MRNLTLYRAMTTTTSSAQQIQNFNARGLNDISGFSYSHSPDPDSTSCIFLEKGHMIEYVQTGIRKIVSLFFGPEEYVIPCHPMYSCLKRLDPVTTITFTHRSVFRTLRQYPESSAQYQGVREQYEQKVNDRLRMQQMRSPVERFQYLQEKQAWVFALASRADIASYLGVTMEELRDLSK